jgi:hypothetical protein
VATAIIPETVTLPGDVVFEIAAELGWLGDWAWDQLSGRTTSGVGSDLHSIAARLFFHAFHGATPDEVFFSGSYDFETDPLYQAVDERSRELGREWAQEAVDRCGKAAA